MTTDDIRSVVIMEKYNDFVTNSRIRNYRTKQLGNVYKDLLIITETSG